MRGNMGGFLIWRDTDSAGTRMEKAQPRGLEPYDFRTIRRKGRSAGVTGSGLCILLTSLVKHPFV